jgi:hypothetical protein
VLAILADAPPGVVRQLRVALEGIQDGRFLDDRVLAQQEHLLEFGGQAAGHAHQKVPRHIPAPQDGLDDRRGVAETAEVDELRLARLVGHEVGHLARRQPGERVPGGDRQLGVVTEGEMDLEGNQVLDHERQKATRSEARKFAVVARKGLADERIPFAAHGTGAASGAGAAGDGAASVPGAGGVIPRLGKSSRSDLTSPAAAPKG